MSVLSGQYHAITAQGHASVSTGRSWLVGVLQGDFHEDPSTSQIIVGGIVSAIKPETIARIDAGWRPDAMWYMRHIRVKFPWRHVMTGNVSRVTELESYQGNAEAETVGQWEMDTYTQIHRLSGIPETAKLWFHDKEGKRHHLWLSFYLRERSVSEADLSEVRAAFDELFPGRTLEDNENLPGDAEKMVVWDWSVACVGHSPSSGGLRLLSSS